MNWAVLKGHGFSRAADGQMRRWALQAAEKPDPEGGGGFNPRIKSAESKRALAPEERFPPVSTENHSFSAACLAPRERFLFGQMRPFGSGSVSGLSVLRPQREELLARPQHPHGALPEC
jgi:hypothetical protein